MVSFTKSTYQGQYITQVLPNSGLKIVAYAITGSSGYTLDVSGEFGTASTGVLGVITGDNGALITSWSNSSGILTIGYSGTIASVLVFGNF